MQFDPGPAQRSSQPANGSEDDGIQKIREGYLLKKGAHKQDVWMQVTSEANQDVKSHDFFLMQFSDGWARLTAHLPSSFVAAAPRGIPALFTYQREHSMPDKTIGPASNVDPDMRKAIDADCVLFAFPFVMKIITEPRDSHPLSAPFITAFLFGFNACCAKYA
jgi:hypothetical protein